MSSFAHLKALLVDYVKIGGRYVGGVVVEYAQGHAFALPPPLVDADGEVAVPCVQRSA